ncbi:hypothetical protein CBR59_29850 [Bacillus thuringiensis]|uniref:alpha/beta hydrolase n=1 Tax=Bacillus thuringiensis TaxID=1428 RepID=UPI000C9E94EC|nr:alpha/beta hydrolase [Bacillus thuringiensis]PNK22787.1 hypothetical protein CBP87_30195 [Bacillus thuringiensis]PNK46432.1 hypothetical protein CBR59_29850 [Bacillus thuringiensis]
MDLDQLGKQTKSILTSVRNSSTDIVKLVYTDISEILGSTRCRDYLTPINSIVIDRESQHQTIVNKILMDQGCYPTELINKVRETLADSIEQNPKTQILKLNNPKEFAWQEGIEASWDPIDLNTVTFPHGRIPFVFVHGPQYEELSKPENNHNNAFNFYKLFEKYAAWLFKDDSNPPIDIYLVSYDTSLEDDKKKLLIDAFATASGEEVTGESTFLFFIVIWKELVRRAEKAGEDIKRFLEKLSNSEIEGAIAITHSLGCHVLAHAAHQLREDQPLLDAFLSWFCMAPTLPSDAFTSTGKFRYAPGIIRRTGDSYETTTVWYSKFDSILTSHYFLANKGCLAMGQTGAGQFPEIAYDIDVTNNVHVYHDSAKYYELLGTSIRHIFLDLFGGSPHIHRLKGSDYP